MLTISRINYVKQNEIQLIRRSECTIQRLVSVGYAVRYCKLQLNSIVSTVTPCTLQFLKPLLNTVKKPCIVFNLATMINNSTLIVDQNQPELMHAQLQIRHIWPAPMAQSYRLGFVSWTYQACNLDVPGSNSGRAGY